MSVLPTFFISHGGGPWSYMEGQRRDVSRELEDSLRKLPEEIGEAPKAILMVSGHWEEPEFTVMATVAPPRRCPGFRVSDVSRLVSALHRAERFGSVAFAR